MKVVKFFGDAYSFATLASMAVERTPMIYLSYNGCGTISRGVWDECITFLLQIYDVLCRLIRYTWVEGATYGGD